MSIIKQLNDGTINKIAAGEVVERPAAIVREVLENSIDAGADDIRIELEQGGKRLIRIQDNGMGMVREDAELCLQRHATSKIQDEDDLFAVRTLGFRGEAIPSIAAVSRFELLSRHKDVQVATKVLVDGGKKISITEAGGPVGTTVTARNIFFNIPARKKFLRTEGTELSHCLQAVIREMLIRPWIDVEVKHNRSIVIRAPKTASLQQRAKALLGNSWGATIAVDFTIAGIQVRGLVSPVGLHRESATNASYLYVNKRYVKDTAIRRAIADAYYGLVPKGRYPLILLEIDLPPHEVDVNVHPAKIEVRFHRVKEIAQGITTGLRDVLQKHGIKKEKKERRNDIALPASVPLSPLPFLEPKSQKKQSLPSFSQPLPIPTFTKKEGVLSSARIQPQPQRPSQEWQDQTGFNKDSPITPALANNIVKEEDIEMGHIQHDERNFPSSIVFIVKGEPQQEEAKILPYPKSTPLDSLSVAWPALAPETDLDFSVGELLPVSSFAELRVIGQLKKTYILCEGKGELVVIDQHAAHERITLYRLRQNRSYNLGGSQLLLTPIVIECSSSQAQVLQSNFELFREYGLEIDLFGESAVAIRQVPEILQGSDWHKLIIDVADNLLSGGRGRPIEDRIEELFSSSACHNSIRAGANLSIFEMQELLEDLDDVDFGVCAHGRPVAIRITPKELEKRFHRN